jgi:hypothetical protein
MARNPKPTKSGTGAPPRSLYRKIQIVLAEAQRGRANSPGQLIEQIEHRGHMDFTRYRPSSTGRVQVVPCSQESIRRVVELCIELGLVKQSCDSLTAIGKRAVSPSSFDQVLRGVLADALETIGTPLKQIDRVIKELLSQYNEAELPTWESIYVHMTAASDNRHKEKFRSYMSLLSACDGIAYSRKKIYLPHL